MNRDAEEIEGLEMLDNFPSRLNLEKLPRGEREEELERFTTDLFDQLKGAEVLRGDLCKPEGPFCCRPREANRWPLLFESTCSCNVVTCCFISRRLMSIN